MQSGSSMLNETPKRSAAELEHWGNVLAARVAELEQRLEEAEGRTSLAIRPFLLSAVERPLSLVRGTMRRAARLVRAAKASANAARKRVLAPRPLTKPAARLRAGADKILRRTRAIACGKGRKFLLALLFLAAVLAVPRRTLEMPEQKLQKRGLAVGPGADTSSRTPR